MCTVCGMIIGRGKHHAHSLKIGTKFISPRDKADNLVKRWTKASRQDAVEQSTSTFQVIQT